MRFQRWISGLFLYGIACLVQAATLDLVTYYHVDHLGSPVATTDERGELLSRQLYRPYGERSVSGLSSPPQSVGFTGHVQEDASDLVYAGARYHDPVIGRFLAVDPVGVMPEIPVSFNRYSYGANNPYRYTDPDGRWAEDAVVATVSIAMSSYSLGKNIEAGNYGWAAVDVGAIVLDAVAVLLPVVPGAVGITVQGSRAVGTGAAATKVADDIPTGAPDFIVSPGGTAFPVPQGAAGPTPVINPAGNQTGVAFTGGAGGENGKVATMRIMDPTPPRGNSPGYPRGYIKYENSASPKPQGVDPYTGKTLPNSKSHFPID